MADGPCEVFSRNVHPFLEPKVIGHASDGILTRRAGPMAAKHLSTSRPKFLKAIDGLLFTGLADSGCQDFFTQPSVSDQASECHAGEQGRNEDERTLS
jgi:hypothetical protein